MRLPQITSPFGQWAAKQGVKNVFTMVADYGPDHDAEQAFTRTFTASGGQIVGAVRTPPATVDFSPFIRRAKDSGAEAVFIFTPAGNQPAAIMKTLVGFEDALGTLG